MNKMLNSNLLSSIELLSDIDSLIRKSDTTFNFKDLEKELIDLLFLLNIINDYFTHFEMINPSLNNLTQSLFQRLTRMKNFNPTSGNPNQEVNSIVNDFKQFFSSESIFLSNVRSYGLLKLFETSKLDELKNELTENLKLVNKNKNDSDKILENLKNTSQDVGLVKYTQIFNDEANENLKNVKEFWSFPKSFFLSFLLVLIVVIDLILYKLDISVYLVISLSLALFTFYFYIFSQYMKQYNSYIHLSKVNKHRANCLGVVEAFVDSSSSEETKEQIRLMATKTIFESGETGIIKSGGENSSNLSLNFVDKILKGVKE
jgi:ABC-type multidrug transport system fused ATPase/permease subunit